MCIESTSALVDSKLALKSSL